MEERAFSTIGRENFPGMEVKIVCERDTSEPLIECMPDRFRIVYLKSGFCTYQNGDRSQPVTAPTVLCINHTDHVKLLEPENLSMDIMTFDPACFERYIPYESIEAWRANLGDDAHFFRAFFDRTVKYIGACPTTQAIGTRVRQLVIQAEKELAYQSEFWPCRSRSFFIELLLLVNFLYDEDVVNDSFYEEKVTDDILEVVNWLNVHFVDKIVLEDLTKQFNTNKTTLNKRFKESMGVTVTEYIINLRMEVACSCLRKTHLTVKEIISRTGYRDDAHFLRAFKKYSGCTPSEYRLKYEVS